MANELSGEQIASLIKAGWVPPEIDYEAWIPALVIFYHAMGMPASARALEKGGMTGSDRDHIKALALAFAAAPKNE